MAADPELAASCRDLVQVYDSASGPVHALRGVSADIPARSMTAVVGPSGAGKSTFLRLLACLERPTVGEVTIHGQPTAHLGGRARRRIVAKQIGYIFQQPADNLLDYLSVAEHVRMAWRMRQPETAGQVPALLEMTDLVKLSPLRPGDLSAGEQQRLAFAMAVAGRPALVIADEPTASLDPAGAQALIDLLPALVEDGQSLVICTHDRAVVDAADQVLAVSSGTLAATGVGGGELFAVIDDAGRIQLPSDLTRLFPGGRARIVTLDHHLRVEPP
ncbi:MAG: ABC transporter ATP-binding protein [Acidimicrobiales bacterium]